MTDVVCLGILVADAIARPVDELPPAGALKLVEEISLHGGGCALNTASALVRLGLTASVVGKVGADPFGDFVLQLLDERGVARCGVLQDEKVPTSATVVLVDSAGERTFLHLPGANGHLRRDELDGETLFSGRALHIAGALVMPALDGAPTAAVLEEARARGLITSLDTVWDATGGWNRMLPSLPHLDLFVPTLGEAAAISGQGSRRPLRLGSVSGESAPWRSSSARTAASSPARSSRGIYLLRPCRQSTEPGPATRLPQGMLYGRLAGWPVDRSAALANAAGALAATAVGAVEGVRGLAETLALAGLESAA